MRGSFTTTNGSGLLVRPCGVITVMLEVRAVGFSSLDPIKMLVWSAVLNGVISVPVMAMMMTLITSAPVMGRFRAHRWLVGVGWTATALMGLVVTAMLVTSSVGW